MPELEGVSVCYVSTADFSGWTRTYKQARTLSGAGARVVVVGYEEMFPETPAEAPLEIRRVARPELPEITTWSSTHPVRVIRIVLNRTVGWLQNKVLNRFRARRNEVAQTKPDFAVLVSAVCDSGADVVQAVDLPALQSAFMSARKLNAKLVYDSHELWSGFVHNPGFRGAAPRFAERLLAAERKFAPRADLLLVTSDLMGARLAGAYGLRPPVTVLNSPDARTEAALPPHAPVRLVFHGRISPDRNLEGLIRAMGYLRDVATLDIHGGVYTSDLSSILDLIEELALADVVRMHGPFEYAKVVDLLREYDVGVMTAKVIEENFEVTLPNKLFDCMCAGLAVAMYDSPAVRAVFDDVPFGICMDTDTPESIARDLEQLLRDPSRIARMKAAAVEASSRYWWPEQGRKLVQAYAEMLGR